MAEQALSGLKVVEYGNLISAPYCAKMMADLGAEVIKVEEPGSGDESRQHGPFPNDIPHPERSGLFLNLNTNKVGVTLNLRARTGQKILKELLKDADVFVENNPPQLIKDLGLDYATLEAVNPRLVMASITPYGQTGPYKDYKAYDINCCAAGGISIGIGTSDREPLAAPFSQGSYQAALSAAGATYVALLARDVIGQGQHIDISEAEVWATLHTGANMLTYIFEGRSAARGGASEVQYPSGYFRCKDGYIQVRAPQIAQWIRFLEVMGNPEWAKNPRYRDRRAMAVEYREEVDALVLPWFEARTKDEIHALCIEARVPFVPVRTIDELVKAPHLKEREFWVEIEHPETGPLKYPGAPYKFSKTPWRINRPAPLLGEHNEEVYCGRLGYSKGDLVNLRRAGII